MNSTKQHRSKKDFFHLMSLDIYLNTLSEKEYKKIEHKLVPSKQRGTPLLSWGSYIQHYMATIEACKKEQDRKKIEALFLYHRWKENPAHLLNYNYQGLVLTDQHSTIQWVNKGFLNMTGYPANFALGKTPRFLQGENTSQAVRDRIRASVKAARPFKERVMNYRKTGEEYECELNVFPLFTREGELSHFLALENEIQ